MRPIDADALVDDLSKLREAYMRMYDKLRNGTNEKVLYYGKFTTINETIIDIEHDATTLDLAPKWISVKDRLPEEEKWVLAYYGKFYGDIMSVMCRRNGFWIDQCFREEEEKWITHWMPLPEPPKEE